jgi:hypothetical protein
MNRDDALEQLASLICFLGFSPMGEEIPDDYWLRITEAARNEYRRDAQHFANAVSGRHWRLMPMKLTDDMKNCAMGCGAGLRSITGLERLWDALIFAAPSYASTPILRHDEKVEPETIRAT